MHGTLCSSLLLVFMLGGAAAQVRVRVVNGFGRCSGRVEVHYQEEWGTVCDYHWDMEDAEVVCRELKCGAAVEAVRNPWHLVKEPRFGQGSGLIWIDNVKCTGRESKLKDCSRGKPGKYNCQHTEDAGVICSGAGTPLPPVYQRCPLNVTLPAGGAVTLSCLSDCKGTCKGEGASTQGASTGCQVGSEGAQLHIEALRGEDGGSYYCSSDEARIFSLDINTDGCVSDLQYRVVFVGEVLHTLTTSSAGQCQLACTLNATCQFFSFLENNKDQTENVRSNCTLMTRDSNQHFSVNASIGATSGFSLKNCSGTVVSPIRTYTLVQESVSWEEARRHCRQNHTDLAVIHSQEDLHALQALGGATDGAWIGLHREPSSKEWKWTNMFDNWHTGYGATSGCVYYYSGKWQQKACSGTETLTSMCQHVSSGSGRSVKVFWYVKQTMSWDDAEESCRKMGGDLASIMTQEEQTAFDAAVEAAGAKDRHIWIGLRRNDHTHPWAWSSGQLQMASAGDEEQNCAVLQDSQRWTPHNCSHTHTHICYSGGIPSCNSTSCHQDDIPSCNSTSCRQGDLLFVGVSRPWLRALEDCEQRGLRLLHILDAATQRRLTQLLGSLPPPHGPVRTAWVGLVHCFLRPLEAWEWVDGPVGYTRWHAHFPRWRFSYHCGQVVQEPPGDYSWWDACCGEEHPYICQEVTSGSRGATTPAEGAGEPCFQRVL